MSDDESGMAAVLAEHSSPTQCARLGHFAPNTLFSSSTFTTHVAAALAEAGYGHVGQARAEAWDEGLSAGRHTDAGAETQPDNPYRADREADR